MIKARRERFRLLTNFFEEGDEPLLCATTLEEMGLALHPFRREIRPMLMRI
jgi:hypothetical protein